MNVNLPFKETDERFKMVMRRELELLIMKFLDMGWRRHNSKDVSTSIHNSSKELIVFLNHKIITYIEDQKKRIPWIELRLLSKNEITEDTKESFLNELVKLNMEPFIDDGIKFTKVEKVSLYYTTACYVNPDMPKGFEQKGVFSKIEEVNKKRKSINSM